MHILRGSTTAALLMVLAGCHATPADLFDREAPELARLAAVQKSGRPDDLWKIVCDAREPMMLRGPAVDRLLLLEGASFWTRCECQPARLDDWAALAYVAGKAKGTPAAERFLLLSLGRLALDRPAAERPERSVVSESRLVAIVLGQAYAADVAVQQSAWCALAQDWGAADPRLHALARRIPPNSPLLDIQASETVLAELPQVTEEILMVKSHVRRAMAATTGFDPRQVHAAPRHLPLIDRGDRLTGVSVAATLSVERTHDQYASRGAKPNPADLAVCLKIQEAMVTLAGNLFAEADRDLRDSSTEHGGLLAWGKSGQIEFKAVPALVRGNDGIYLPPEALFEKLRDGLAHVHFHAQKHDNGAYAGPGRGDLQFAERNRLNSVVFTFVDANTLNADAFFPGGVVVDLGCIHRPMGH